MRPGDTKNATIGAGWVRLGSLYNAANPDAIKSPDGSEIANQASVIISGNAAQSAFGTNQPNVTGMVLNVGDKIDLPNQEFIRRAWFRNNVAGSDAVAVITPIYEP